MVAQAEFASLDERIRVILGRSVMWGGRFIYDTREWDKMRFSFEK